MNLTEEAIFRGLKGLEQSIAQLHSKGIHSSQIMKTLQRNEQIFSKGLPPSHWRNRSSDSSNTIKSFQENNCRDSRELTNDNSAVVQLLAVWLMKSKFLLSRFINDTGELKQT